MIDVGVLPAVKRGLPISRTDVVAKATEVAFGKPLVTNILRSMLVEAMIDAALTPEWKWCSADYAGWDFEHTDGTKLEVKQSAARQSWASDTSSHSLCSWDIAARAGHWIGSKWIAERGRHANIYILAHHPVVDASADHGDPQQWRFFIVPTTALPPNAKRISLPPVQRLAGSVSLAEMSGVVERLRVATRR